MQREDLDLTTLHMWLLLGKGTMTYLKKNIYIHNILYILYIIF